MSAEDRDRERLARTFDQVSDLYHRVRPDYPAELYTHVLAVTRSSPGTHVLEIGSGTGKATTPLAAQGLRLTCLEPGPHLAAAARHNVAEFPTVEIVETTFEAWQPPAPATFDLVIAATSWHWIDPAVRYEKAAAVLRPGGHLAFWSANHVFPDDGDRFFHEVQEVYDEINESLPPDATFPRPGELPDERDAIEASGRFEVVDIAHFDWETVHDADGYIRLLQTFSGHIAMEPWQRDRLFSEIRTRLAKRSDGLLRRHWGAVLHVARLRG